MSAEQYTVLLSIPEEVRNDATPWDGTFLWHVDAENVDDAVQAAQIVGADAHGYHDPDAYAPLFVCYGEHDDLIADRPDLR